jgi:hypothetical protein
MFSLNIFTHFKITLLKNSLTFRTLIHSKNPYKRKILKVPKKITFRNYAKVLYLTQAFLSIKSICKTFFIDGAV